MISYITNRNIRVYNADNQISYNSDYIAEFHFDNEWNGKIKTARFVQNGEYFDVVLVDDRCKIPPLKTGFVKVGVFSDSMTSTYADVYFKTSIKDGSGNPVEPPEDVYAQLTALIESGILKGDDGLTPYVSSNNNWWIGDIDTGVLARGTDGEDGYTPVKGVDYFTEEEIQQIQNEVSGGAIGDFKAVVDEETATFNTNAENTLTSYNANAQKKFDIYNANADSKFETYNTNAETKFSGYNTNAEAKFSEYTNNADTKLAEYNQNDSDKTDLYNTNAESKLGAYDSNAQAKLDLYNQNDSEKTETYNSNAQTKLDAYNENADNRLSEYNENADNRDAEFNSQTEQIQSQIDNKFEAYNTNAEKKLNVYNNNDAEKLKAYNDNHTEKMTAYDTNATDKLSTYNTNAEQKLEAYNSNHTEKLTEYNANAETKTAEFDANAAALQTEVDRLRVECDNLAAENRKQENRIDALIKLNKGQTYDILPEEGESASRTAPSGAKYVSVDKVGGKSVVWNQLNNPADNINVKKGTIKLNDDGSITISGTVQDAGKYNELQISQSLVFVRNQKYLVRTNKILSICVNGHDKSTTDALLYSGASDWTGFVALGVANGDEVNIEELVVQVYNLTQMFGAGNEPTIVQFKKLFVQKIYPYNSGEIISSRTATITVGTEAITTGFPELKSAGTAHDEIDMDGGEIRRNVGTVDLGTLKWDNNGKFIDGSVQFIARVPGRAYTTNGLCDKFEKSEDNFLGTYTLRTTGDQITFRAPEGTKMHAFVESMSGATLYYELATPTTEPVTIPEALQEWIPVEPGGTVTFRNSDETKQLAVPNAVSWVRKLDEVN